MSKPTVFLLEDVAVVRSWLIKVLRDEQIPVREYATATELLDTYDAGSAGCLVLDLHTPHMTALELCQQLATKGSDHPFIIITGRPTVADARAAFRMGAIDFLEKPLDPIQLVSRVQEGFDEDRRRRLQRKKHADVQARLERLTKREREVLELVADGWLTKQIARQLGVCVKTIEAHRSRITKKMECDSVPQLVRAITEYQSLESATSCQACSGSRT